MGMESDKDFVERIQRADRGRQYWDYDNDRLIALASQAVTFNTGLLQDDLKELLNILDMPDHARPQSPHDVFQEALRHLRIALARLAVTPAITAGEAEVERVARLFHDRYEHHAHEQGWVTHVDCRTTFEALPEHNRKVMLLTVADVLAVLAASPDRYRVGLLRELREALEETNSLVVAMMHETRPDKEIHQQVHDNRTLLIRSEASAAEHGADEQGEQMGWRECENCKKQTPDDAFCHRCGNRLPAPPSPGAGR